MADHTTPHTGLAGQLKKSTCRQEGAISTPHVSDLDAASDTQDATNGGGDYDYIA